MASAVRPVSGAAHLACRRARARRARRSPGCGGRCTAVEQALGRSAPCIIASASAPSVPGTGEVQVALFSRYRCADRCTPGGAAPLRLLQVAPAVQAGHHRVGAPDQDQAGPLAARDRAEHRAHGRLPAVRARGGADRALSRRSAEAMEEAPVQAALHQAHGAAVAVGQDRARVLGGDLAVFLPRWCRGLRPRRCASKRPRSLRPTRFIDGRRRSEYTRSR